MSDERPAETLRLAPQYTGTAEFQAAVDAAVKAQLEALLPALTAQVAEIAKGRTEGTVTPPANVEQGVMQGLALQLAELTGQGTGRIYVAPEIIEKRRGALARLKDLLLDLYAKSNHGRNAEYVPSYVLTGKVYLNMGPTMGEVLIEPLYRDNQKLVQSTPIDWPGFPNALMSPTNEAARQVHALFCEWTGIAGPSAPDELQALTQQGAVIRGKAASVLLRGGSRAIGAGNQEPGEPQFSDEPTLDDLSMVSAVVRRADRPPTTKVQVLGTLTKPVEVS